MCSYLVGMRKWSLMQGCPQSPPLRAPASGDLQEVVVQSSTSVDNVVGRNRGWGVTHLPHGETDPCWGTTGDTPWRAVWDETPPGAPQDTPPAQRFQPRGTWKMHLGSHPPACARGKGPGCSLAELFWRVTTLWAPKHEIFLFLPKVLFVLL